MELAIESFSLRRVELSTRLPFRYGIAVMEHVPHAIVELCVRVGWESVAGRSADHLPPKWFTKDPARPVNEEIGEMETVILTAGRLATGLRGETVFALWTELYGRMESERRLRGWPPLLAHFGTSLVERALIDAFCRATRTPFAAALVSGSLGLRLDVLHPELSGTSVAQWLPSRPLASVQIRHTVGLSDPIDETDALPPDDGLPRTLSENIDRYGLEHFKIKVTGPRDLPRLERILGRVAQCRSERLRFTLDGNESFGDVATFRELWAQVVALPVWLRVASGLICVEQPFHRDIALSASTGADLKAWTERPPMIIDESDAEWSSVRDALAAGYVGTSHKNCKGVFKGAAAACLLAARREKFPGQPAILTGEDLCNVGPLALLQDLAVQAALGVSSVERNGHHYLRGLSFLAAPEQAAVEGAHLDLFERHAEEFVTLRIAKGAVRLDSVNAAPFGLGVAAPLFATARAVSGTRAG